MPAHPSAIARARPIGTRKSKLLGPTGQPLSYFLYPSPRHNLRAYKPRYQLAPDTKSNVGPYDRGDLVNYARQLRAQVDVLATAVEQKNSWAFGDAWDPHYLGANKKWGAEAKEYLQHMFFPMCNVRGPQYDLRRSLVLSGAAWDVDGDDAMVLTQTESGFPQVAFFPATRIGSGSGTLAGGPFDGATLFDGVISDRSGRMIGLRILGEDGTATDLPASAVDLAYEPAWHDQGRGIPRIAVSLLRWMNLQDIDEFLQRGVKRASSIGLIQKNEEGEAAMGNEVISGEENIDTGATKFGEDIAAGSDRQIAYEEIEGGEMYFLSSVANESIEALDYKNPHPNVEAFIERIQRSALASIGWFYELLDLNATGRAPSRLLCDLANQTIWDRQATGERRWRRMITYAIAKGMKSGLLTSNNDGRDPYLWEPGLPKHLSVDAGNDEQADRENLKIGTTSKAIITQKKGYHLAEINRQREAELTELCAMARRIKEGNPEITFERALELLEQRSPNPITQQPQQAQQAPQPSTKTSGSSSAQGEPITINIENKMAEAKKRMIIKRDSSGAVTGIESL
jgi:Phage portal protein, lambda family